MSPKTLNISGGLQPGKAEERPVEGPDRHGYWRSLEQLSGDPKAREFMEREFPEHASEAPDGVSRRTMLTLLGASLSLAGMTACRRPVEKIVPYVTPPEEIVPGVPLQYATTMTVGHHAYGLVVESHEGRPTKIEGNKLHSSTLGASSAAIQASILGLYDPDRSQGVTHGAEDKTWADFETAWAALDADFVASGGQGLAVLLEPFSSPTLKRLVRELRNRLPQARVVVWDPVSDENVLTAARGADGPPLRPIYNFALADVVLSLESDFLLTEGDSIRQARGFAERRRLQDVDEGMNRLYVVESGMSMTGGNADHRLRLRSGRIANFLAHLADRLSRGGLELPGVAAPSDPLDGDAGPWLDAVVADLLEARGRSLVVAGRHQPPQVHAAAFAINRALENFGKTLQFVDVHSSEISSRGDLADLVAAMREGSIRCLFTVGGNPAYAAPVDLEFSAALGQVEQTIHAGLYRDETATLATWHLPLSHYLESWGDAQSIEGTPGVIQPLIAPLYGGRSTTELLGLLATGTHAPGHEIVRRTWQSLMGQRAFEARWNRVLHDGIDARAARLFPAKFDSGDNVFSDLAAIAADAGGTEIAFRPSPSVFDGRWANNGWLQELPDPVTKLTWDNAAMMSPTTATDLGVTNGDLVEVTHDGRSLELPAWVVPGQADGSIHLELGYGRRAAGRVGNGRGFDVNALRTSSAPYFAGGAAIRKASGTYALSTTQDHYTVDELGIAESAKRVPTLIRETTLEDFRAKPNFVEEFEVMEEDKLKSLWQEHSYDDGLQWGMTIDLNVCTGCNACVTACQSENNIPVVGKDQVSRGREMHWIRVDRYFRGPGEDPRTAFQPVPCMHCENAPCEQVCPVAATVHDDEGLNTMVYNRCIGTRYCQNNCPYKVRRFNFYNFTKDTPEVQKMAANPDVTVRSRGVMEKCTYCTQRINGAKISAKLEGRELADGDVTTACEQACPTRAITFGNIRDPESRVSRAKAGSRDYAMIAELNNKPRTSFLARITNPNPRLERDQG